MFVTCNPKQLDERQLKTGMAYVDTLTSRISRSRQQSITHNLLIQRAVAYTVVQDYDGAIADLNAVLADDSTNVMAHWQRAACSAMMNEFDAMHGLDTKLRTARTVADFTEALRYAPQNQYLYYDRGTLYALHKEYASAIDDYTIAIKYDPNLAEAYYNRGLARIYAGQKAAGISDLSKAGELGLYNAYAVIKRNSQ